MDFSCTQFWKLVLFLLGQFAVLTIFFWSKENMEITNFIDMDLSDNSLIVTRFQSGIQPKTAPTKAELDILKDLIRRGIIDVSDSENLVF